MPITSKHQQEQEEFSCYAYLIHYKAIEMALDHFFLEVVEGNVPLTQDGMWWDREIVRERVNRYSEPWCLLFEALAHARERISNQGIPLDRITFDANLNATIKTSRYGDEDIKWVSDESGRF